MNRLFEAGLTVLLVANLGVPVEATPEGSQPSNLQSTPTRSTDTQPAVAPSTLPNVEARKVPVTRSQDTAATGTPVLSERDRLIQERRLQKLIPVE